MYFIYFNQKRIPNALKLSLVTDTCNSFIWEVSHTSQDLGVQGLRFVTNMKTA